MGVILRNVILFFNEATMLILVLQLFTTEHHIFASIDISERWYGSGILESIRCEGQGPFILFNLYYTFWCAWNDKMCPATGQRKAPIKIEVQVISDKISDKRPHC